MSRSREIKSCLHLVARSSDSALERCTAFCCEGDDVLFIDDAVMFLAGVPGEIPKMGPVSPTFLKPDLDARGLAEIAGQLGVRTITDTGFTALLRKHDSCLTWK